MYAVQSGHVPNLHYVEEKNFAHLDFLPIL